MKLCSIPVHCITIFDQALVCCLRSMLPFAGQTMRRQVYDIDLLQLCCASLIWLCNFAIFPGSGGRHRNVAAPACLGRSPYGGWCCLPFSRATIRIDEANRLALGRLYRLDRRSHSKPHRRDQGALCFCSVCSSSHLLPFLYLVLVLKVCGVIDIVRI